MQQGLGKITVSGYIRMLNKAVKDMGLIWPSHDDVFAYMVSLKDNNKSYSHRLNSRNLMTHLMYFYGDPIEIPRERKPKRVIKNILNEEEIKTLFKATKTIREKAIILTLAYSGLRVSELSNLTPRDLNFENRQITVRQGKGSKDRIVNITDACAKTLKKYISDKQSAMDDIIFSKQPIIRRTLKRITKRTDITKRVHPHSLRHSLATNLLLKGCDLVTIQKQLGHSDVKTTTVYLQLTDELQKQKYNEYAPQYAEVV